ncbi:MAG: hypothetical protein GY862_07245 [Gammaproteobacteria bacterium]|nr:hypothetical protein [Gammaproteobacteria bacterium]
MQLEQENELWQSILAQTDSDRQRIQLVEMAKLLLEKAALPKADMSAYDDDDLIDLLLEYQLAGNSLKDFFEYALPYLDPAEEGEFERQLQELKQNIARAVSECDRITAQRKEWQEQESSLQAETARLEETKVQADSLARNLDELRQRLTELTPEQERLEKLSADAKDLHSEIVPVILKILPRLVELLRDNHDIYTTHFLENKRIADALAKLDELSEMADQVRQMERLGNEVDGQLRRFDETLSRLVIFAENKRNTLKAVLPG